MTTAGSGLLISAFVALLGVASASAADWDAVVRGETTAAVANLDFRAVVVRCDSGNLALSYLIPKEYLAAEYKGAADGYLVVMFDEKDGGLRASFPAKFIERDIDVLIGITGRDAAETARAIAQASQDVFVGISLTKPTEEFFDRPHPNKIPLIGARDAINSTLVACGFEPAAAMLPVAVEGWHYDASRQIAKVEQEGNRLEAVCLENQIVVIYSVASEAVAAEISGLERAYIVVTVDQRADGSGGYFTANTAFPESGNTRQIGFGEPAGLEYARKFGRAGLNVVVGIAPEKPGKTYAEYNVTKFPVGGSGAAIRALFADCGKRY